MKNHVVVEGVNRAEEACQAEPDQGRGRWHRSQGYADSYLQCCAVDPRLRRPTVLASSLWKMAAACVFKSNGELVNHKGWSWRVLQQI